VKNELKTYIVNRNVVLKWRSIKQFTPWRVVFCSSCWCWNIKVKLLNYPT